MTTVGPVTYLWAVARSLASCKSRPGPISLESDTSEYVDVLEQLVRTLPKELHWKELTLLFFTELVSRLGGFSEPVTEPWFSPERQQALNVDFRDFLADLCGAPYVHIPSASFGIAAENNGGDQWWTTPTLTNALPSDMLNGGIVSPTIRQGFSALGGVPLGMIMTEDSPYDSWELKELWRQKIATRDVSRYSSFPRDVLRITSARDFVELVEAYPLFVTDIPPNNRDHWQRYGYDVAPNWQVLSARHEGVMLSAQAYLEHSWVPLDTSVGRTRISGWKPEVVYLLAPWSGR